MPRSYGIFYLTAKSLLRHCKKIVLITWLLSGKFYIFNIDSKAATISFYCVQYYEYDHCFFYSFATSWYFTYIRFYFLVVLVIAILKSNLERIPKHTHAFSAPCRAGPPAQVHMANFHLT